MTTPVPRLTRIKLQTAMSEQARRRIFFLRGEYFGVVAMLIGSLAIASYPAGTVVLGPLLVGYAVLRIAQVSMTRRSNKATPLLVDSILSAVIAAMLLGLPPFGQTAPALAIGSWLFGFGLSRTLLSGELTGVRGRVWLMAEGLLSGSVGAWVLLAPLGTLTPAILQLALGTTLVLDGAWQALVAGSNRREALNSPMAADRR